MTGEQSTNKRFVLTDESINSSGFWIRTAGGDLSQFEKNPLMLWSHMRVWKGTEDEVLPIGNWKDVKVENGVLTGEPYFDEDDLFAVKIKNKVDKGIIRMASVGIRVIETSADPKYLKPGQTRETITKWKLIEASICDIGRNENALAFYDSDDNLITFSEGNEADCPVKLIETNQTKQENMKTVTTMLNLSDSASEQEVFAAVKAIQDENQTLKAEKDARDQALKAEQKTKAEALLIEAFKDGRLNDDEKHSVRATWEKFFETDHEGAKQALSAIQKPKSVKEQFAGQTETYKAGDAWAKRQAEIEQNAKK